LRRGSRVSRARRSIWWTAGSTIRLSCCGRSRPGSLRTCPTSKRGIISLSATYQHDDPKTWEEIRTNGDAAILGVGHCSNCSPAVSTHAITLETKYNVPTVALHTDKFDRVVQSVTKMAGMPEARRAFVPQPVMGKSAQELRAYVEGLDPISGRPVMQEIVEGLTTGLHG
jgi:hypothetical protein